MKLCANYVRGCRTQLDQEYKFTRCQDCLKKDREKDKAKRDAAKLQSQSATDITEKICTTCCKLQPIESFDGVKGVTKTCSNCREQNKLQDSRRDKEHRNELARKNEAKPECIAVKKQWKEANYEKVAETWMNSRANKIERLGVDEYASQNSAQAKNWRDSNPEKVAQINEDKKNNVSYHYSNYQRTANLKNLDFDISFEDFCVLVINPCHYCGEVQERGFNGIDRKDQAVGYNMDNGVSCCSVCNYMKNTLSDYVFVKKIEHILLYNKLIKEGEFCDELFVDTHKTVFGKYKERALRKQLDFMLLFDDFQCITSNDCYICGKKTNMIHQNGIDRFDNTIGYIEENCRSCCSGCNYMKRNYTYDDMMDKFQKIHKHYPSNIRKNIVIDVDRPVENILFAQEEIIENIVLPIKNTIQIQNCVKTNKKSKEEITENARLRKQKQRESLKEKYGDEEYKKLRASEIAKSRADKKTKLALEKDDEA
jgi:hypothetical protein